jgi:hypothetical protein
VHSVDPTEARKATARRFDRIDPTHATEKVVSGGPVRAVAFPQADAGLPDTTFFISAPRPRFRSRCGRGRVVTRQTSPTNLACGEAGESARRGH